MIVDLQVVGLIVAAVFTVMTYNAYRSNQKSDASWERMRRDLTPVWQPQRLPYEPYAGPIFMGMATTSVVWPMFGGTDSGRTHQHGYIPQ